MREGYKHEGETLLMVAETSPFRTTPIAPDRYITNSLSLGLFGTLVSALDLVNNTTGCEYRLSE